MLPGSPPGEYWLPASALILPKELMVLLDLQYPLSNVCGVLIKYIIKDQLKWMHHYLFFFFLEWGFLQVVKSLSLS